MLCVPEPSKKATENDIKYWAETRRYFQCCKSPGRAGLHLLLSVSAKHTAEQSLFPLLSLRSDAAHCSLVTQNSLLAVDLPQKRLVYSSQPAATAHKAGPCPLVPIQRGFLRFKFLTQGSLGQRCGGVGTSQSLGFISASGTPRWYSHWQLCSLLLMHGPSCWQAGEERRGEDRRGFFFSVGWLWFFAYAQLVDFPWAIPDHPSNFSNLRQVPDRARKPPWGFWRTQKPDAGGKHHLSPEESHATS